MQKHTGDSWQKLGEIAERVKDKLAPVTFIVPMSGPLALAVFKESMETGNKPETIISEAVRAYMGEWR